MDSLCLLIGLLIVVVPAYYLWEFVSNKRLDEEIKKDRVAFEVAFEAAVAAFEADLREARKMPTSSTARIEGRKIRHQIRMVVVSDETEQDSAELKFLNQVKDAGGNGAVNVSVRRHKGGYVSMQGDAVELE